MHTANDSRNLIAEQQRRGMGHDVAQDARVETIIELKRGARSMAMGLSGDRLSGMDVRLSDESLKTNGQYNHTQRNRAACDSRVEANYRLLFRRQEDCAQAGCDRRKRVIAHGIG